jgi:hypothetical protein
VSDSADRSSTPTEVSEWRDDREFLLAGATWQDSLLQTYRSIHLGYQAITFAIGVGIFAAALAISGSGTIHLVQVAALSTLIGVVAAGSLYVLARMRRIVQARGEDVSFWHRKLILHEGRVAGVRRPFTEFKVHQKMGRSDAGYLMEKFLGGLTDRPYEEHDVDLLIEKGLGHTRRVLDRNLFRGIAVAWWLLIAYTAANLAYTAVR